MAETADWDDHHIVSLIVHVTIWTTKLSTIKTFWLPILIFATYSNNGCYKVYRTLLGGREVFTNSTVVSGFSNSLPAGGDVRWAVCMVTWTAMQLATCSKIGPYI